MFALSIVFSPIKYAYAAFEAINIDLPLDDVNTSGRVFKGTPEYDLAIQSLPGFQTKTHLQPFLDQMGIRKDIIFIEANNPHACLAIGTNLFTKGDAAIVIAPDFELVDKEACHSTLKHEISHIKQNDMFISNSVAAISSLAAIAFCDLKTIFFVPALVGFIAYTTYKQFSERRADDFAIVSSSVEELKGRRRFLISAQQVNLKFPNPNWKKIFLSSTGESLLDFSHPSLACRIKKIELALKEKNVKINEEEENKKIAKLTDFFIQSISKWA